MVQGICVAVVGEMKLKQVDHFSCSSKPRGSRGAKQNRLLADECVIALWGGLGRLVLRVVLRV